MFLNINNNKIIHKKNPKSIFNIPNNNPPNNNDNIWFNKRS